jgi:hypothetical protein
VEWENTVADLFGLSSSTGLSAAFAADALDGKAFDNDRAQLAVSPNLWSDYQTAAETLAERVTGDPELLAPLLDKRTWSEPQQTGLAAESPERRRARAFIEGFGLKAYRRPLSRTEVEERLALFEQGALLYPLLEPFVAGVRANLAAFLQSPHFLYRSELSPQAGAEVTLDGWEIASRLSYAIWSSMPDRELYHAAAAGELATSAGLNAEVERLVASPRASAALTRFFEQLYQSNQYQHLDKDVALYPDFTPDIGSDMQGELRRFTQHVYEQGGGLRELLTSTTSFVTPRLAAIYGLPAGNTSPSDADGFFRVELDPAQRSGLLTRSGFLAWKGGASQPNTIQRGVFITRRIVCQQLGNPPASAQGATFGPQATDRERITTLTGPGTCGAGCHGTFINPAGFAFEHFGALGEYRAQDAGILIDSSATFPFAGGPVSYRDASELSRDLAESPQAHACFSSYLLEYLFGREPTSADATLAAELAARSLSGASTRELVVSALENKVSGVDYPGREKP